ncbi:MAG: high-potential iron-sulfur protein [Rubricoccaceae bacterium]
MSDSLSRRRFLAATAGAVGVVPVLAACGGESAPTSSSACAGYDALTEADMATRNALNYVDKGTNPAEICSSCRLYNLPESGSACGGCQLFAGPVLPGGYCTGWAAIAA